MSVPDDGLEVQAVTNPGEHTESPVWDWRNKGLLFVDIAGQSLHFYDPKRATVRSIGFGEGGEIYSQAQKSTTHSH